MTYGQLRLIIQQENPGISQDLADAYIQDRYTQILDRLMWKRQEAESVIQIPASYAEGTIAVTQGSNAVTGTGTTFTAAMTGRMIRVSSGPEYYQFAYASATTGTLDRAYEGADDAEASYRIDQALFLMPADARHIAQVRPLQDGGRELELVTPDELNRIGVQRTTYGTPRYAARAYDSFTDPPRLQIEFYPVPVSPSSSGKVPSFAVTYQFEAAEFDGDESTGTTLLPWLRPGAIRAGVRADWLRSDANKDYPGSKVFEDLFNVRVAEMQLTNARQRGPQPIRISRQFRRHSPQAWPSYGRQAHPLVDLDD